jgi:hypothetical protein
MSEERKARAEAAARRVIGLEEEVEASGFAQIDDSALAEAKAALHAWIDGMIGIVVSPALGRVTVLHEGRESAIASPELAYRMSKPV